MPVLEQTSAETIHRSVAASIKSPSKKSKVNQPSDRVRKASSAPKTESKKATAPASAQVTDARPVSTQAANPAQKSNTAEGKKVCWIETKLAAYTPDHQVELLHLQAEADALLIKLQAKEQQIVSAKAAL